jgi:ABC-type transport system involved in multi-copper enzyme maturation permease subunit
MSEEIVAADRPEAAAGAQPVVLTSRKPETPSVWRAWWYLVRLSVQRQSRAHHMLWIALILLGLTATIVLLNTARDRWAMYHWRSPRRIGPQFSEYLVATEALRHGSPWPAEAAAVQDSLLLASRELVSRSGLYVFSTWIAFSIFMSFLLPIWSMAFATEALGGERESGSLLWLLTRPLPRSSIYLAKFVALLPWALTLNVGGFAVLCLAAGEPGRLALRLYWPAVLCGSLAFCSLFHLISACFRRAAIVALVYSFFLEIFLGNMPGYMKRVSIGFYARCMMFDELSVLGIQPPQKASVYLPVDGATALTVLLGMTVAFLLVGALVFARTEYQDLT